MFSRLFKLRMPLGLAVLLVLAVGGSVAAAGYFWYHPTEVKNYQVYLAQGKALSDLEYGSNASMANQSYFQQVKQEFLDQKADFIEADLSAMKLTVYKGGESVKEFPILTKGREGSWWETPAGLYKIEGKEKNHYSSFAGVNLPWSMPFQGNFFIHGWPYYPDGTPVNSKYSGGCIRLSTDDAKQVFDLVAVGTPVLVHEKDFALDNFAYKVNSPQFEGRSYLAADLSSNFPFMEKAATEPVPIASLTKLMTALVAVEYVNIEHEITITKDMIVPTSLSRLKPGQKLSLYNLLPPLLEESSNEAAEAISRYLGRDRFVDLMNKKAKAIGMLHTSFVDPSGRGDGNVSTAQDLLELARYLHNNRSFILKMTKGEIDDRVYGPLVFPDVKNFNGFQDDPDFAGGKVGLTNAAGETLISIFDLKKGDTVRPIAIILLNVPDHFAEARQMLDWIKQNYY